MKTFPNTLTLARLFQLASPALPVGGYSYSQGLESAIDAGIVRDEDSALTWIGDVLDLSIAPLDAPLVLRLCEAWQAGDAVAARKLDEWLLASRESAELRAEAAQMGYSLAKLLTALGESHEFDGWDEVCWHTTYAYAAVRWEIEPAQALAAFLWSWAENQVIAAVKAVPLGQSAGQRILFALGSRLAAAAERAAVMHDDDIGNMAPGLALMSAQHETQYSRLFRS